MLPTCAWLRVAVLRHHPLPIALVGKSLDDPESESGLEPFLVLRNSGDLLGRLQQQKCDLVLHSHKHWLAAQVRPKGGARSKPRLASVRVLDPPSCPELACRLSPEQRQRPPASPDQLVRLWGGVANTVRRFIQGWPNSAVGGRHRYPHRVGETVMTPLPPPPVHDEDETKWSFLRRLILAIAAERQQKADEVLQRQAESRDKSAP
jgi:hypothetical protein